MAKKRANGEGTIRKRADGRWEGRIVIGHKNDGRPIVKSEYGISQKAMLRKMHRSLEVHRDIDLTEDSRMTLSEWLDRWLNQYMAGAIRESTLGGYRKMAEYYINPILGDKPIYLITTMDVQKMYTKLKKEGRIREHAEMGHQLSDTMVRKIHTMLHHAMKTAVQARLIAKNPTEGTTVPKCNYKPKTILNDEELDRFMEEIKKDPIWYDFFYTEITTGMRLGEICSLQWDDFDAARSTLKVRRTFTRDADSHRILGDTKTYSGNRVILLPPSTVMILKERQKQALTEWIFWNPIFPEHAVSPDAAYRRLKQLLEEADLPNLRFHDLRHTFATHAISNGVDAKTLSGILGHTNASFTLDTYTHVTSDMHHKAAAVVGNFLDGILGEELEKWGRKGRKEPAQSDNEMTDAGKADT